MPEQGTQKSASSTTNPYKVAVPLSPARTTPRGPTPPPFSIGRPTENREFAQCFERLVDARPEGKAGQRCQRVLSLLLTPSKTPQGVSAEPAPENRTGV